MRENLLGHLLGALDPSERESLEAKLREKPELEEELHLLRRSLEVLEEDVRHFEPPPRLAERTCNLLRAGRETAPAAAAMSARWGLHDVLVAASVLAAACLLFFPAVSQSRYYAQRAGCEDNLRVVSRALVQYADRHGDFFPKVPVEGKLAAAGIYGPTLIEQGFLDEQRRLVCPGSELAREPGFRVPTRDELEAADGDELKRLLRQAGGSYGYVLGYVEDGRYLGPRNQARTRFALVSDEPCSVARDHKSPNHGRCGQNVLFEDGHVRYLSTCRVEGCGDALFFNDRGEVGVGLHANDAVIVRGDFRPVLPVSPRR